MFPDLKRPNLRALIVQQRVQCTAPDCHDMNNRHLLVVGRFHTPGENPLPLFVRGCGHELRPDRISLFPGSRQMHEPNYPVITLPWIDSVLTVPADSPTCFLSFSLTTSPRKRMQNPRFPTAPLIPANILTTRETQAAKLGLGTVRPQLRSRTAHVLAP